MPNISIFSAPPEDPEAGFRDTVGWRIPVDDEHQVRFEVTLIRVTGEKAERYKERLAARRAMKTVPFAEIGERVLRGELRIEDYPREEWEKTEIIDVQDYVALCGQGIIPNGMGTPQERATEHLGQSDQCVVLWRNIWRRELKALHDGRPLKDWCKSVYLAIRPNG
jgi:5,5'-dehydrodivanillate O-demethylase